MQSYLKSEYARHISAFLFLRAFLAEARHGIDKSGIFAL
jgi:hypothetical protein